MKPTKPPTAYTDDERRALVAQQEASGMTVQAFALSVGLPTGTLSHWRWRLRQRGQKDPAATPLATPAFVQVAVDPPRTEEPLEAPAPGPTQPFEIVFPKGLVVRVPTVFDPLALRRLLHALEASSC